MFRKIYPVSFFILALSVGAGSIEAKERYLAPEFFPNPILIDGLCSIIPAFCPPFPLAPNDVPVLPDGLPTITPDDLPHKAPLVKDEPDYIQGTRIVRPEPRPKEEVAETVIQPETHIQDEPEEQSAETTVDHAVQMPDESKIEDQTEEDVSEGTKDEETETEEIAVTKTETASGRNEAISEVLSNDTDSINRFLPRNSRNSFAKRSAARTQRSSSERTIRKAHKSRVGRNVSIQPNRTTRRAVRRLRVR